MPIEGRDELGRFTKGSKLGHRFPKGHRPANPFPKGHVLQFKHGLRWHHLYHTWIEMMRRCYDPKAPNFKDYGERGIEVWEPWRDLATFTAGITALLGNRPKGYTLDRVNPHYGYYEENVRWADKKTQKNNNRNNITDFYVQCGEH
jgi:hypothetical protein